MGLGQVSISDADRNLRAIAVDLIRNHIEDFEFLNIAEDEALGELPELRQQELYELVLNADINATWGD
jgi:hypothetical protein